MSDSPQSPDSTHPLDVEELKPNFLYAVITYRGELATWNWAFFVPNPAVKPIGSSGTMVHVVDHESVGSWKLEQEVDKDVISWPLSVAIMSLADVSFMGSYEEIVGPDGLLSMFKMVKIPQKPDELSTFSSRTWFLDAICVLHDCVVVHCDDVWLLEREIRRSAFQAMDKYLGNKGWTAYASERCT